MAWNVKNPIDYSASGDDIDSFSLKVKNELEVIYELLNRLRTSDAGSGTSVTDAVAYALRVDTSTNPPTIYMRNGQNTGYVAIGKLAENMGIDAASVGGVKTDGFGKLSRGTEANLPSNANSSDVYFATDTKRIYMYISGSWQVFASLNSEDLLNLSARVVTADEVATNGAGKIPRLDADSGAGDFDVTGSAGKMQGYPIYTPGLSNDQVLSYNSTSKRWENKARTDGVVLTSDVSTGAAGKVVRTTSKNVANIDVSGNAGKVANKTVDVDNLKNGDGLVYDSAKDELVNKPVVTINAAGYADINVTGNAGKMAGKPITFNNLADGQIPVYRESEGCFVNEYKGSVGAGKELVINYDDQTVGTYDGSKRVVVSIGEDSRTSEAVSNLLSSGLLQMNLTTGITGKKNSISVNSVVAKLNGRFYSFSTDIVFDAAPNTGYREDFAIFEVWRGKDTSGRASNNWNIRTINDVNFSNDPYGMTDSNRVKAHGGNSNDTSYAFSKLTSGEYRAGDGSDAAKNALGSTDGYVYAIPLFRVHRRNQTAYSKTDNPYGAPAYNSGVQIASGLYHDVIAAEDVTAIYPVSMPYGGGNWDAVGQAINDAETLGQVNWTELQKWKKQRIQQGVVTLYNRFIVSGCIVGAVPGTRNIQITATGTYDKTHYSRFWADGQLRAFDDVQSSVAAVPTNTGTASQTYYSYLLKDGDTYKPHVDTSVPDGAIRLYRITVPAGDTGADLSKVSFADERRVETNYTAYYNSLPFAMVTLPGYTMPDAPAYGVELEVESASGGLDTVGQLHAIEKGNNGFKIISNGTADNVVIRWTLVNPDA